MWRAWEQGYCSYTRIQLSGVIEDKSRLQEFYTKPPHHLSCHLKLTADEHCELDLNSHSIINEPIDHGVAIVADTNTWTCRVVVASKTYHNNGVVLGCGGVPHSHYVRQLLSSVKSVWEMKLPPEFTLLRTVSWSSAREEHRWPTP